MNTSAQQPIVDTLYRLESVEPAPAPGSAEGSWFRYVIVQGSNRIVGFRSEPLTALRPILDEMVNRLNERSGKQFAKSKK